MRNVVHVTVVDFKQPVSVLEATAFCHSCWHHISDDVALAVLLLPQLEAIGLPVLPFEDTETGAGS